MPIILNETELNDEQRLYAGYISGSSGQMQLYIKTLIDISRAAAGYQLYLENMNLSVFVKQIQTQIDALCQVKKIELKMTVNHLLGNLTADKLLLERAIMNVVNNALNYSPNNGCIYISFTGNSEYLQISVTDEGKGFSQEDLLHEQEQFYIADRSRSFDLHFGMGLFISKSIVQQHGGQLILENSKDTEGAKVILKIPC